MQLFVGRQRAECDVRATSNTDRSYAVDQERQRDAVFALACKTTDEKIKKTRRVSVCVLASSSFPLDRRPITGLEDFALHIHSRFVFERSERRSIDLDNLPRALGLRHSSVSVICVVSLSSSASCACGPPQGKQEERLLAAARPFSFVRASALEPWLPDVALMQILLQDRLG